MSANADLITVKIYVQKGKDLTFISGPKCVFLEIVTYFVRGYNKHFPNYEQILNILMG